MIIEYPCLHFWAPNTEWLAGVVCKWAQNFIQTNRVITTSFQCQGSWFKFVSTGARVEIHEMFAEADDRLVFSVEHTGDGLTFQFASNKKLTAPAKIVASHVRDYASNQRHLA